MHFEREHRCPSRVHFCHALTSATRSLQSRTRWALTGLGLALLVLLVLPSAQIKLGASQLHGLIGSYTSNGHYWQVTYSSQGSTTWTTRGTGGAVASHSAPWNTTDSGFSLLPYTNTGLDAKCVGQVTGTLTWLPTTGQDSTTDPPPTQVIVTETGAASFSGGGVHSDHGTLLDGWAADTPPASPNNIYGPHYYYNTSGTHSEVKDGTSGTITVGPFSLNASTPAVTDSNAGNDDLAVAVSINFLPASVIIDPVGATKDTTTGKYNILVGQGFSPTLVGAPTSGTTYTWTVDGVTFQDWNGDTGNIPISADLGSGPLTQQSAHWFWNDKAGIKNVSCTARVTPSDGQTPPYTVIVKQAINLEAPTWTAFNHGGWGYIVHSGAVYALQTGPTPAMLNQGFDSGSTWQATVSTPSPFSPGQYGYASIITPGEYLTLNGGTEQAEPEAGRTELDGQFPYLGHTYSADGTTINEGDSPAVPFGTTGFPADNFQYVRMADTFKTYLMFKPPLAASAINPSEAKWVPLAESDWSAKMGTYRPIDHPPVQGHWSDFSPTQPVGGVSIDSDFTPQPAHPSWNQVSGQPHG